jgi:hypothetical protein
MDIGAAVEEAMGRKPAVQTSLDLKKLSEMQPPYNVRLVRERPGTNLPPEPIKLPNDGLDYTVDMIRGLEQGVNGYAGGGSFHAQVQDANGGLLEWRFFVPTRPSIPADVQMEAARVGQAAQAAAAQAAQMGQPVPVVGAPPLGVPIVGPSPIGTAPPMQMQPPPMGVPQDPWAQQRAAAAGYPPGYPPGALPAHVQQGQQQGSWQQTSWGPVWVPAPQQQQPGYGWQQTPWGPMMMPPGAYPQLPYGQPLPATPSAAAPFDARLAALEDQNRTLREELIRKNANEGVNALSQELRALAATTQQQITSLADAIKSRPADVGSDKFEMMRLEMQRQADNARAEAQRAQDNHAAELRRIESERKADNERMLAELRQRDAATAAAQQNNFLGQVLQSTQVTQQEAARSAERIAAQMAPHMLTPDRMIQVAQSLNPKGSTIEAKMAEAFMEMATSGAGQSQWPQVAATLGSAVIDTAKSVTTAIFGAREAVEKAKMVSEARAAQQLSGVAQRARPQQPQQQQVAQGQQPAQVGAGAGQNGHNQHQPQQQQAAAAAQPLSQMDTSNMTAAQILEADERAYFGATYEPVLQLRRAVAAKLIDTDRVLAAIGEAYTYFCIEMELEPPAMVDAQENPEKLVRMIFPDADGPFRAKIAGALPALIAEIEKQVDEQDRAAEAQAEQDHRAGGTTEEPAGAGAPASEGFTEPS